MREAAHSAMKPTAPAIMNTPATLSFSRNTQVPGKVLQSGKVLPLARPRMMA
jgi:hypothetical protein